jgi:putative two-component system response regulator
VAHLGLPEVIPHPGQEEPATTFFRSEDFRDLMERLRAAGPEHPVVEATYALTVGGSPRWSKVQARAIWVGDLSQLHYEGAIGKIVDIHEDTEQRVRLQQMADTDALTGLLNHRAAKNRISALLADQSGARQYALILFDLDNFKMANDIYGHLFGDEVLRHVADTVRSSFRSSDITARMGGDEFLIFLEYKDSALPLVQRIFQRLCVDFKGFSSSVSMGVAYSAQCGGNYEKLFQMADIAMYEVKRNGKRNFRFYDADK